VGLAQARLFSFKGMALRTALAKTTWNNRDFNLKKGKKTNPHDQGSQASGKEEENEKTQKQANEECKTRV